MQKALTQMNIQLASIISDISGVTGQKDAEYYERRNRQQTN